MAPRADDELRMLQARAYGQDAAIPRDEQAAERLRRLQHVRGGADIAEQPAKAESQPTPRPQQPVERDPESEPQPVVGAPPKGGSVSSPPAPRRGIRVPVLAASLVATALLVFGTARLTTTATPFTPQAAQVGVLVVPDAPVPAFLGFVVTDAFSEALRDRHPAGTALPFVLDEDGPTVIVFEDARDDG